MAQKDCGVVQRTILIFGTGNSSYRTFERRSQESMKTSFALALFLSICFPIELHAQAAGYLSIRTTEKDLLALIDSNIVLVLPVDSTRLTVGSHTVKIQNAAQWNALVLDTTVVIATDNVFLLTVPERHTYTILSEPSGASVTVHDNTLGVTPLSVTTDRPLSLPLALSLSHFETLMIGPPLQPVTRARLFPDGTSESNRVFDRSHSIRNYSGWIYGSITAGILSGTISILAKTRADKYNDNYLSTGNPSQRDKSKTLDLVAASALLITEVSFGVLSYLLLTQ